MPISLVESIGDWIAVNILGATDPVSDLARKEKEWARQDRESAKLKRKADCFEPIIRKSEATRRKTFASLEQSIESARATIKNAEEWLAYNQREAAAAEPGSREHCEASKACRTFQATIRQQSLFLTKDLERRERLSTAA